MASDILGLDYEDIVFAYATLLSIGQHLLQILKNTSTQYIALDFKRGCLVLLPVTGEAFLMILLPSAATFYTLTPSLHEIAPRLFNLLQP